MKRTFTSIALAMAACLATNAASWVNVTSIYVQNPSFADNKYNGWEGTAWSGNNPKENAEHYQMNYDTYQTVTGLPKGRVRVSCKGFYRAGTSAEDYSIYKSGNYSAMQLATLYARSSTDSKSTPVALLASGAVKNSLGGGTAGVGNAVSESWWGTTYEYNVPNNMEAAYYWFQAGHYSNSVTAEVGDDGTVTFGVRKEQTLGSDWSCFDDFQLEWYGDEVKATAVNMPESKIAAVVGEEIQLKPTAVPENVTFKAFSYRSSNTAVATVDANGKLTALSKGTATIYVTCGSVSTFVTVNVTYNKATVGSLIINELMASNIDVYRDPSTNFGSWVELYNTTDKAVALGGLYVTDDPNNLKKYRLIDSYGAVPARGYGMINFDHYEIYTQKSVRQINGKLSTDGGTVIISDGMEIIDQVEYPASKGRISYARTVDGAGTWGNCGTPTPEATNNGAQFAEKQLDAPVVDKEGQFFTGNLSIKVTIPEGTTLKYTIDGTAPTLTNGQVSANGVFTINNTRCYRFRLFKEGSLPSQVVTRSYIYKDREYPHRVISIVSDYYDIFDSDNAVFAWSENGRPGNGQTSKYNANMDWDRPVNFEYFVDGKAQISQECDFAACGGWSRGFTPHSFKLKAKKVYDGMNYLPYPFFSEKPYNKHKTLQIRNGGNDNGCRIKDAAMQQIVARSGLYVDYQAWEPVHVFINGSHYAVLNMREPNNKHHGYANYAIDDDFIEQFEICPDSGYVQMEGSGETFRNWYELSRSAADKATYEQIGRIVDLDEYINYMAVQMYLGGTDFPQNNVKGYRDMTEGAEGKFHFVLFDLDFAFNTNTPLTTFAGKQNYTFDTMHGYNYATGENLEGKRLTKENKFVTIFLNMLKNETFKKKFIDAYCLVNGSIMVPERVKEIVNDVATKEAQGGFVNPWNTANQIINNSSSSRQNQMITHLRSYFGLQSPYTASLSSNVKGAVIMLNDMQVPTGEFEGQLFGDVTVEAEPITGYTFKGWSNTSAGSNGITILPAGSTWKYYDTNSLGSAAWTAKSYSDNSWKTGTAPIGYGKSENKTNNLTANKSCYYFRKNVDIANADACNSYTLNFKVDDGFIIYVNGKEAGRYNMPSGNVTYNTVASSYAPGNPDSGTMALDASLFVSGSNTIAVEVHNNATTSSDILWDGSITAEQVDFSDYNIISTSAKYKVPASGVQKLTAVYEPVNDDETAYSSPLVINEVSAANDTYINDYFKKDDWVEIHNTTSEDIDIAGLYITDNENKPTKFQIPTDNKSLNTIIPAKGYKLIWCSKRDIIGQDIHASFKLADDGGIVMITMKNEDGSIRFADKLTYGEHDSKKTVGRFADGTQNVYVLDVPTPGAANKYSSYAEYYAEEQPGNPTEVENVTATDRTPNDAKYNIAGQRVDDNHEGIVISNDKKYLNK